MANYFIGVEPAESVKEKIISDRAPSQLHVTLSYLGKQSPEKVELIKKDLEEITSKLKAFKTKGSFYGSFRGKVPHLGLEKTTDMENLKKSLDSVKSLQSTDGRPFVPHVTIGKDASNLPEEIPDIEIPIDNLTLYESRPDLKGEYNRLATYKLQQQGFLDRILDAIF